MTPSELKAKLDARGSKYFSRENMRGAGDTMRNFGVRKVRILVAYGADGNYVGPEGEEIDAWELYRKQPTKMGQDSAFFRADNYERTWPKG